jgi:hypothetical protein
MLLCRDAYQVHIDISDHITELFQRITVYSVAAVHTLDCEWCTLDVHNALLSSVRLHVFELVFTYSGSLWSILAERAMQSIPALVRKQGTEADTADSLILHGAADHRSAALTKRR